MIYLDETYFPENESTIINTNEKIYFISFY